MPLVKVIKEYSSLRIFIKLWFECINEVENKNVFQRRLPIYNICFSIALTNIVQAPVIFY